MDILTSIFGNDISNIIISKISNNQCIFDNCIRETLTLQKYCRRHWCSDGHSTNQKKYRGYCEGCFTKIIQTDNKKYIYLVTNKYKYS
jgi:hypothetical protein